MDPERRKAIQVAMLRLADGDRSAMPEVVMRLWPVMLSLAERGIGEPQGAEDVAQEVLFRISSRISELDRSRDAVSWAFGIATYEIMTHRRRRQRRRETFAESDVTIASVEEAALQAELHAVLAEALGELSVEEVASLGLAPSKDFAPATAAARKRRQRALDHLRLIWRRLYGQS